VFKVILSLIVVILGLPLRLVAEILVDDYCTKRPTLDNLKNYWIVSCWTRSLKPPDIDSHDKNESKDDQLLKPIKSRQTDMIKLLNVVSSLSQANNDQDMNTQLLEVYYHNCTPQEEVRRLLEDVRQFLRSPQGYPSWKKSQINHTRVKQYYSTMQAIRDKLGINPDGTKCALTLRQRLMYRTNFHRLVAKVSFARDETVKLVDRLEPFRKDEVVLQSEFIIQQFILGQSTTFLLMMC
jgi:hypothetical protein